MNTETDMKNGVCPKCKATDVYVQPHSKPRYDSLNFISTSWWGGGGAKVQNYVCITCGYLESYIDTVDIKKLAAKWERVELSEST